MAYMKKTTPATPMKKTETPRKMQKTATHITEQMSKMRTSTPRATGTKPAAPRMQKISKPLTKATSGSKTNLPNRNPGTATISKLPNRNPGAKKKITQY